MTGEFRVRTEDCRTGDKIPGITVVIPVRNRVDELLQCTASLRKSFDNLSREECQNLQVVVVDDRSTVSIEKAVGSFPNVTVVKNNGSGPGAARNTGVQHANYEYIGFIDSDCIAHDEWLRAIIDGFHDEDVYAIQGNPCLFRKDTNPLLGMCEERLYTGMWSIYLNGRYCYQIDTRNCAFRKSLTKKLGGEIFTSDMKKAQAEARVCGNNLVVSNVNIRYLPQMIVYHNDPRSLKEAIRQKMRHGSGRVHVWEKIPTCAHLFKRYYLHPITKYKVPFWYVIPTHSAFIYGYFAAKYGQSNGHAKHKN